MGEIWILPLVGAFSVFPLWLIEQFLPWPWLIEELFKLFVVLKIRKGG
jgi:hypothetical protein